MTIEFQCPGCGQTLKAPDTAAGKKAKCPKCQQIAPIPNPAAPPPANNLDDFFAENLPTDQAPGFDPVQHQAEQFPGFVPGHAPAEPEPKPLGPTSAYSNPYASPEALAASDGRFGGSQSVNPTPIDAMEAFGKAWASWQKYVGYLLLCNIIAGVILFGVNFGAQLLIQQVIVPALVAAKLPQAAAIALAIGIQLVINFILLAVQSFILGGVILVTLDAARGKRIDFAKLFGAGEFVMALVIGQFLIGLLTVAGVFALIIGAIIVQMIFWPFMHCVVDRRAEGAISGISVAWEIGKINLVPTLIMFFLTILVTIGGLLACIIGILVAGPLVQLMYGHAYLMMIGEQK